MSGCLIHHQNRRLIKLISHKGRMLNSFKMRNVFIFRRFVINTKHEKYSITS